MPKLLFVTTLPFYPDASGGSENSSIYLFKSLRQLGWQVEVICGLSLRSPFFRRACWQHLKRLRMPSYSTMDEDLGYPCWRQVNAFIQERQWFDCLEKRLQEFQPDYVLSHYREADPPLIDYAVQQGYSSFYFVRWLGNKFKEAFVFPDDIRLIANSPFTASSISQFTKNEVGVVLPFVDFDQYKVAKRHRQYITFVNPVPPKGLHVAIEIARQMPQERFLFVRGKWGTYTASELEKFMKPISKLPNVEVWDHQWDMRKVYAVTNIMLVPSQFIETFGRIIVEAQVNGIPVVAANVGGIPYTLGQGGILVDPKDQAQNYVDALLKLCANENFYTQLSDLALKNSQRFEFDPHYQVKNFVNFIEK